MNANTDHASFNRYNLVAVTFFSALVLLLETVFFHVLDYVHDYYAAIAVISSAILGIGLGAFIAGTVNLGRSIMFSLCCLGLALSLSLASMLIVFTVSLWGAFLFLPFCFFFPGLFIATVFRNFRVNHVYYFDMVGAFLGIVMTYLLYAYLTSESILIALMLFLPALGIVGPILSKNFGNKPLRVLFIMACLTTAGGGSLLSYLQLAQDRFNLFKLMPRDWGDSDKSAAIAQLRKEIGSDGDNNRVGRLSKIMSIGPDNIQTIINRRSKAYRYLYPETAIRSYENVVGRIDVAEWNRWSHLVIYNGYTNDHFTRAVPKDYSRNHDSHERKWPTTDIRVLYGVTDEPKVYIIGSAAQGILKTIRKITPRDNITAVEINPAILRIMSEDYYYHSGRAYEGIKPILGNALSLLKSNEQKFDIITLINSHSTRTIGYRGAPDYLHTKESYSLYFDRLSDDGYVLFEERPINRSGELGFFRMLNTLWQVLEMNAADDPGKHFVIWEWTGRDAPNKYYISMIVTKNPITGSMRDRIVDWITMRTAKDSRCNVIYFKGFKESEEYRQLFEMIKGKTFSALAESEHFDAGIVTNDRPFPQVSTRKYSQLNKLLMITGIPALVLWFIITIQATDKHIRRRCIRLNSYCVLIGFAYMFVEIVLIQRYQNIFISPSAAFILILGLCLLSSGIGGFVSQRIPLPLATALLIPFSLLAIYVPDWMTNSEMPSIITKGIGILLICITGFFMGVYLPQGLNRVRDCGIPDKIPHYFAINAVAGSFATVLALVLGVRVGYQSTVITSCLAFGAAWIVLPKRASQVEKRDVQRSDVELELSRRLDRKLAAGVLIVALILTEMAVSLIYMERVRFSRERPSTGESVTDSQSRLPEEIVASPEQDQLLHRAVLLKSLELGRKFLLNNQKGEGNFNYEFDWVTNRLNTDDNQVRQAGALWGLALIHQYNPTSVTRMALQRGFAFFDRYSKYNENGNKYIVYPNVKRGKTGTVALVSLALIDFLRAEPTLPEREIYVRSLHQYLNFLSSTQKDNGQFHAAYRIADGKGTGDPSPYFDGEILLALMRAVKYLGFDYPETDLLQSAEIMYRKHVETALDKDPDSAITKGFFQWGIMAFYEIYTSGWSQVDISAQRAIEMAYWMIDVHRTLDRTRNTAYAHEGLISAWELARMTGRRDAMAKIGEVIDKGLYKLTTWQVGGPVQNEFLKSHSTTNRLAIGGVMNRRNESGLRIDVTQHQMHAVLLALTYIYQSDDASPLPAGWSVSMLQKPLLSNIPIYNAHEHIDTVKDAERYLKIANQFGIQRTIILGSYRGILDQTTPRYKDVRNNNEDVLEMARRFPNDFVPFVLIRPDEDNKLEKFKQMVAEGARGLHIRGGLGSERLRIDGPGMWPVYAYCESENYPVFLHFTEGKFDAVQNILRCFPQLKLYVPHLLYSLNNLEFVRTMLDKYPNLYTDLSYGYLSWMKKSFKKLSSHSHVIHGLIHDFPNQFLWGSDHVITEKTFAPSEEYLSTILTAYRDLFEQERFRFEQMERVDQVLNGFGLPETILEKIYFSNARQYLKAKLVALKTTTSDPGIRTILTAHPEYEPREITTVLLTGSSLPGEGMVRTGNRKANRLEPARELQAITRSADLFHMSIETPLLTAAPKKSKWKFYSTARDWDFIDRLGVDVVELTGNHLLDYGTRPVKNLVKSIQAKGICYFGGGVNHEDATNPLSYAVGSNRITFIGFNMVSGRSELATNKRPGGNQYSQSAMVAQIQQAKAQGDIVCVHFQWGDEFNPQPWLFQRRIAHKAIDTGADVIVGTHTHALVAYEKYKGNYIFYGLGNFLFRHDERESTQTGAMIKLYCAGSNVVGVERIPVKNDGGKLVLLSGEAGDRVLQEWEGKQETLSNPEVAQLDLDLAYLHTNDLNLLKRSAAAFKRSGVGQARIFVDSESYGQAKTILNSDSKLKESIELGVVIDEAFIRKLDANAASARPTAIELPENYTSLPRLFNLLDTDDVVVVVGDKWASDDITTFLEKYAHKMSSVFVDFERVYREPERVNAWIKRFANLNILIRFHDNNETLTPASFFNTKFDLRKFISEWDGRIHIGAGLNFSEASRHGSAMTNYATRYLMTFRNLLELERVPIPARQHAHKEWGYPYSSQTTLSGFHLKLDALRKLYTAK